MFHLNTVSSAEYYGFIKTKNKRMILSRPKNMKFGFYGDLKLNGRADLFKKYKNSFVKIIGTMQSCSHNNKCLKVKDVIISIYDPLGVYQKTP